MWMLLIAFQFHMDHVPLRFEEKADCLQAKAQMVAAFPQLKEMLVCTIDI